MNLNTSRVVPGYGDTIAASRCANRFSRVDFPAFGGPAIATTSPSRRRSPRATIRDASAIIAAQLLRSMKGRTDQILRHISLVGKVDPRLDQRQRFDDLPPPRLGPVPDQTLELPERLPPLGRRLRGNEVGQAFDFGQIEAPVLEGAPRELARLSKPAALDAPKASSTAAITE